MKNKLFAITFIVLISLNIVSITALPFSAKTTTNNSAKGIIQIKVLELNNLKPIADATVCIIENSTYVKTNKNGETEKIEVPVLRNTSYDNILLKNWGEFTILIYKPGYETLVSFYNEVYAGLTRIGLVCYLSQANTDTQIVTNTNAPNSAYIETLIMHYKK